MYCNDAGVFVCKVGTVYYQHDHTSVMQGRFLVVGAGISGSVVANMISRDKDNMVTVIDRLDHIGGNCYDYRDENGIMIHKYGSHIFHTSNDEVWEYLNGFTSFKEYTHRVRAVIKGEEVVIPFNFDSIHHCFSDSMAERIEKKLLDRYDYGTKIPIRDFMEQDDEDLRFLAQFVYDNVFVNYTSKQWGKDPKELDGAVTARVPVLIGHDSRYFQDKYQGIPSEGYTKMIEKMLNRPNIEVKLSTDFRDIDIDDYDEIFYTGPVDELMGYEYGQLPYRSERFVMETYEMEHYQSGAVINYPNDHDYTRIHEYKYYLDDESDRTVIAKEYPEEFSIGKNERYYPIPTEENDALYRNIIIEAQKKYPNVHFLGRLGDYKYYDMDKAVARAMEVYKEVFL